MTLGLTPLLSLLAGVLILIMPRLLRYVVALFRHLAMRATAQK